jgi:hypothetical protein
MYFGYFIEPKNGLFHYVLSPHFEFHITKTSTLNTVILVKKVKKHEQINKINIRSNLIKN